MAARRTTKKAAARDSGRALDAAPVFAALGDPTRLRLVAELCRRGPMSIARLTEGATVTRQAVTKHLHALEEAGLVRPRESAGERTWEMRPARIAEGRRYLEAIAARWQSAFAGYSAGRKASTER